MKYGYLREDDTGHWYLIPQGKINDFRKLMDELVACDSWSKRDDISDRLIEEFEKYRLSGGVEDLPIQMTGE